MVKRELFDIAVAGPVPQYGIGFNCGKRFAAHAFKTCVIWKAERANREQFYGFATSFWEGVSQADNQPCKAARISIAEVPRDERFDVEGLVRPGNTVSPASRSS